MHCTSCRLESSNLRPYRVRDAAGAGLVHLCAACRVLNALHPRYEAVDDGLAAAAPRRRLFPSGHRGQPGAER